MEEQYKIFTYLIIGGLLITVVFAVFGLFNPIITENVTEVCPEISYYFDIGDKNVSDVYGFYHVDKGYFCVGTMNRSLDDVLRTVMHELVHVMVEEERVHFDIEN